MSRTPEHRATSLLFFVLLVSCVAAQPPLPQPSRSLSVNFNPMVAMLMMLIFTVLFFVIFFSIYIIDHTSSLTEPVLRVGMAAPVHKGLVPEVIMGFPMFVYSEVKEHKIGKGALECAVCLCEFEDYETLRLIPKCDHVFHSECIDEWLSGHVTCPVCRANLALPSEDSVKDGTDGWGPEEHDHVEMDIDERTVVSQEAMHGRNRADGAEQLNGDLGRDSHWGKPLRWPGRSHSMGHSLVHPSDDIERFTLKLSEEARKQIMEPSMTPYFPCEGSSRRGFRSGDGSSRGRFIRRLQRLDRPTKSERWFLARVSSLVPLKFATNDCRANMSAAA